MPNSNAPLLTANERGELLRIINDLNDFHEALPQTVLIPDDLAQLFA